MNSPVLKKHNYVESDVNGEKERLYQDAHDLFLGKKTGHMNAYAFNEPDKNVLEDPVRGGEYWARFIHEAKDYYLIKDEGNLIKDSGSQLKEYLPSGATIVDLGPGEDNAVINKTIPFVRSVSSPKRFIAMDVNGSFATKAANLVSHTIGISSSIYVRDFLAEKSIVDTGVPCIMCLFGGLLCNTGRTLAGSGLKQLASEFQRLRSNTLKSDDYLVITQDSNGDEASLIKAYTHPYIGKYILSILHKIKRDLPVYNFDADRFEYIVRWNKQESLMELGARLKGPDMKFILGRDEFRIASGQEIVLVNSYKFPVKDFITAATSSGFEFVKNFVCKNNGMTLHIFKALPHIAAVNMVSSE